MSTEKTPDTDTPIEESGAGYGNNAETDVVTQPGDKPDTTEDGD